MVLGGVYTPAKALALLACGDGSAAPLDPNHRLTILLSAIALGLIEGRLSGGVTPSNPKSLSGRGNTDGPVGGISRDKSIVRPIGISVRIYPKRGIAIPKIDASVETSVNVTVISVSPMDPVNMIGLAR